MRKKHVLEGKGWKRVKTISSFVLACNVTTGNNVV